MSQQPAGICAPLDSALCVGAVEDAPVGICVVQDGLIVHANRWLRDLGLAAPTGRPLEALALIHPDDRELAARQLQQTLADPEPPPTATVRLLAPEGGVRLVELHTVAIASQGRPAVRAVMIDVTARVNAEQSAQQCTLRFESSSRFSRLFGDILSHDLMNPVWIAENYLRLAMDGGVPAEKRAFYEGMRNALSKARGILADARTYLRVQDQVALVGEALDVCQLVETVAESLRGLREEKGQTLVMKLAPGARVNAGPYFSEVVSQLLSNAIKHGPRDSAIAIAVGAGPRVRIEVRDRGPGVPPEHRTLIFQRFENMDKGPIGGVGLGLAIVRRVVELHGGQVWVEDNPGGGSAFIAEFTAVP